MPAATLVITLPGRPARRVEIHAEEISIGRALDNAIRLEGDGRIAPYHALIAARPDGFWLSGPDIRGASVNGEPVESESPLHDGDVIDFGGGALIEIYFDEERPARPETGTRAGVETRGRSTSFTPGPDRRRPPLPLFAGVCLGAALTLLLGWMLAGRSDSGGGGQTSAGRPAAKAVATKDDSAAETSRAEVPSVSPAEVEEMTRRLAKQISSEREYVFAPEFLRQVSARTGDYLDEGFDGRARQFRDVVNGAFVGEQGLAAPLGYVSALSRSGFHVVAGERDASGSPPGEEGEGLWRLTPALARGAGYIGRCGVETLSDPGQRCSASVAAAYMKFLVVDLFDGDYVYAVACFGMTTQDAARFRDGLRGDRRDFWDVLESAEQRERVVRFFAAGAVGANPRRFGLVRAGPLTDLYPQN